MGGAWLTSNEARKHIAPRSSLISNAARATQIGEYSTRPRARAANRA